MQKTAIHFTFCHQKPSRSFFWRGKKFPVCARCTGIHIGYLTFPIFLFGFLKLGIAVTVILVIPTILDGLIQAFTIWESNNLLRFTTGLASGIGLMSAVSIIGKTIGEIILQTI